MPVAALTSLGRDVRIYHPELVNIYAAMIGDETRIGPFVEIQGGVIIGARCKIQSHVFIPEGVTLEDGVFIGHGVMFTNDRWPRAINDDDEMIAPDEWVLIPTLVKRRAVVGSGAVLLPVVVGEGSLIGAGAVVTRDVEDYAIVAGNPARIIGDVRQRKRTK
jgi:UDP-2-acetamido-3-amino-2,3-dideoxy-glucuronate N-acetyltransferase